MQGAFLSFATSSLQQKPAYRRFTFVQTSQGFLRMKLVPSALLCLFAGTAFSQSKPLPYMDSSLPAAVRAHDAVSRMTLDEKAAQLEDWATAIPRLGIPDYQTWSEALHGVANSGYATVFPQAIGMAATWDRAHRPADGLRHLD